MLPFAVSGYYVYQWRRVSAILCIEAASAARQAKKSMAYQAQKAVISGMWRRRRNVKGGSMSIIGNSNRSFVATCGSGAGISSRNIIIEIKAALKQAKTSESSGGIVRPENRAGITTRQHNNISANNEKHISVIISA